MEEVTLRALRQDAGKLRASEEIFRMIEIEAGCIVESLRGRDAGKRFLVLSANDVFAQIADGQLRRIEKPKLKKIKHLKFLGIDRSSRVYEKIFAGITPDNAEIRKAINLFSSEEVQ